MNKLLTIAAMALASVSASHFEDLDEIENFKFDRVVFNTKKDCALDKYPDMRQFLEVESAHYPKLEVLVASEGQSRIQLYNEGKEVDEIHIYKYTIDRVRELMEQLGLERDEKRTWKSVSLEAEMRNAFENPNYGKEKKQDL